MTTGHEDQETRTRPNIPAIMAEIREKIRTDVEKFRDQEKPFKTSESNFTSPGGWKAGGLLGSDDLRFLNQHHGYATSLRVDHITTHRRGVLGRFLVRLKQKVARTMRFSIFSDYFTTEAEFSLNLVRFLNEVGKYVDGRDAAIFWELIRKIDTDLTNALNRIERISDEQTASLRSTEKGLTETVNGYARDLSDRIGKLESHISKHESDLKALDGIVRGLEGLVARVTAPPFRPGSGDGTPSPDLSYALLENRYRGGEAEIERRLLVYPPIFKGASKPVLDIGPGRGELLSLFRKENIDAYGVEIDQGMVEISRSKGLRVEAGDGIAHLRSMPAQSLGGIIAIQVVEHLDRETLRELFALCKDKVVPGGRIVFETVNPQSLTALSSNYFRDPSHVFPLHPDTLSYSMTLAGLKIVAVKKLSPFPEEAQLRQVPVGEHMTPRWADTVKLFNYNIQQLNSLLYGFQDYCVIAEA